MRFHQATSFLDATQIIHLAQVSDDLGYGGMYVSDHLFNPKNLESRYTYSKEEDGSPMWEKETHWPDPMCTIAAMAGATTNLEFTTGVYIAPLRDLMTVVKSVGTTAVLSNNRLNLGVGVGWCREEFEQTGQDFTTRGKRLDEMIDACRALWNPGWVEYHGTYYDVPECQILPAPTKPIPFICGGHSPVALKRTAERCDGWVAAGAYPEDEAWIHLAELQEARKAAGTEDRSDFRIFLSLFEMPSVELYTRFYEAGVTDFICAPWMMVAEEPGESRERLMERRLDEVKKFADEIVHPCAEAAK
jgi:probable F420-dependent oxidoreductase